MLPFTHLITAVRSGLCSSGELGSFITTLPSGVALDQTSIFTSGVRFDPSSFPSGGDTIDVPPEKEDPTFEEVSSIGEDVVPGAGMSATGERGAGGAVPTGGSDGSFYGGETAEEQGKSDVDAEQQAEDAAEELYNEILDGGDGFDKRRTALQRRQSRLPRLRVGYAGGQSRRQIGNGDYEKVGDVEVIGVDDEGNIVVEDLPIEVNEDGDVIVEYPDGTISNDVLYDDEPEPTTTRGRKGSHTAATTEDDWYDEQTSTLTSTSRSSRPTSGSYKTKPSTSEGISEGSNTGGVPVYTAPIVYRVKKTGYYCVGE